MDGKIHIKRPEMEQKKITLAQLLPADAEKLKDVIRAFLRENAPAYGVDPEDFSMLLTALTIEVSTAKR